MAKWPTWDDLITLWNKLDWQLYQLIEERELEPYDRTTGWKYIDKGSLGGSEEPLYEEDLKKIKLLAGGDERTRLLLNKPGDSLRSLQTPCELVASNTPIIPEDCMLSPISFTLSRDPRKAKQQIVYAKENFIFESDNVLKVARKHDLPLPDEKATGPAIIEDQQEAEQKVEDEEDSQEVVESKKEDYLKNPAVIELLKKIKPGMESLFNDLKEREGFNYDYNLDREIKLQKGAIAWLNDQDDQEIRDLFKKEYFKDHKIYSTDPKQTPRDFIGPLLKKIVKDQIKERIGGQFLYDIYKEI